MVDEHDVLIDLQNYVALAQQLDAMAAEAVRHGYGEELHAADPGAADLLRRLASVLEAWADGGGYYPAPAWVPGIGREVDPVSMWREAMRLMEPVDGLASEVLRRLEEERADAPWAVVEYAGLLKAAASEVRVVMETRAPEPRQPDHLACHGRRTIAEPTPATET